MHRVHAKVNRSVPAWKIANAPASLRRKIEDRSAARHAMRNQNGGRKFVRRVNQPARSLRPGLKSLRFRIKIPAENHRSNARAGIRAASDMLQILLPLVGHDLRMWRGSIGLPQRHDIPGQLKPPAEDAGMNHRRERSSGLKAHRKELEVGAIPDPSATLQERTKLPLPANL